MRILQLIQAKQYRGAEIFCCQISNHMEDLGHEVLVVSIYNGTANLPFKGRIRILDRPKNQRWFDYEGWRELNNIIRTFDPHIVQANAADTLKYAVLSKISFKWNVPIVYRNASASSYYMNSKLSRRLNKFLLKHVSLVISVSNASKLDLNSLFPNIEDRTTVIPIGIENKLLEQKENLIDDRYFNIVHVGSFTREKNHHRLIEIFEKFLVIKPDSILHLVGEGSIRQDIEKLVLEKDLSRKVMFYGESQNPLGFIRDCNVLVLPSVVEGLPAVILEAMLQRTVVVAYNVGGISEILNNHTGYLVELHDENTFVQSLQEIASKENNGKINNAYEIVRDNFGNVSIAKKFIAKFQELVQNNAE